eukprot:gene22964-biopygen23781
MRWQSTRKKRTPRRCGGCAAAVWLPVCEQFCNGNLGWAFDPKRHSFLSHGHRFLSFTTPKKAVQCTIIVLFNEIRVLLLRLLRFAPANLHVERPGRNRVDASHTIEFGRNGRPGVSPALCPSAIRAALRRCDPAHVLLPSHGKTGCAAESAPVIFGATEGVWPVVGVIPKYVRLFDPAFPPTGTRYRRKTWPGTVVGKQDYSLIPSVSFARPERA